MADAGGFSGSVTLAASGLPTGVTASFDTNPTTSSSVITLAASSSAAAGTSTVTITGTSGSLTASTAIALTIGSAACASTPITPYMQVNGAAWQQTATATVASGSTVNLGPQPLGGTWNWTGPNGFTSTAREIDGIPLSSGANTFVATYTSASTCSSSETFVVTVTGSASFTLSPSASSLSVAPGSSGTDTVTVEALNGFSGSVTLAASGLPTGVTASFGTNPTTASSVITLAASSSATDGTSTVTITGTSGSLTANTAIALTIGSGTCASTPITPYMQVNGAAWQQTATATVASGSTVNLGPQPLGGTWNWTGPNGFTSTAREIDGIPLSSGANTFVATYTNASACSSSETFVVTVTGSASFTLSPSASSLSVAPGSSGTDTVTVAALNGFSGSVTLAASGLPTGVTASFGTNPTTASSVITLAASSLAAAGTSTVTITGTSGSLTASTAIALTIGSGTCASTPITPYMQVNGAAWQQTATATVASGSTVNLGPQPLGGTWNWTGPNGFTSAAREIDGIPLSSGANTFVVTYTNASSCSSSETFVVTVTGSASFTLSPSASSLSVAPGSSGTDTVTVEALNGFSGSVTLAASGLPTGVTASFGTNPTTASSVITLAASSLAAAGTSTVTITGTSGSLTANTAIALTIGSGTCASTPITPYMQVNGAAWQQTATATVASGSTVNLGPQPLGGTWNWTGPNGFTSTAREIDGIPLSSGANTFVATYTNASACSSSETFVITVTGATSFTLSPSASSLSVTGGTSGTDTVTVEALNGFSGSVTLAASGLPTGVTASFGTNPTTASSVITLAASSLAAAGTSTVTITGTSGSLTASTAIALTIASACPITPYIQVNGAAWQQTATATVASGSTVNLGPQPLGGTWNWTGPNGFTSAAREIDGIPLSSGANTFVATYTNASSCTSSETFVVTENRHRQSRDPEGCKCIAVRPCGRQNQLFGELAAAP